jgi:hypothetical protein
MRLVPVVSFPDPLTVPTWLTAIFTGVLAIGAIVTAIFAIRAFRKQSAELGVLQQQAKDQSEQLGIQRQQADDQRKVGEKQTTVLELQARELSESLDERKRNADEQRRSRAALVYVTASFDPGFHPGPGVVALDREPGVDLEVHNTGGQPIYDVRVQWVDAAKGSQAGAEDVLGTLPPGDTRAVRRDLPSGTAPGDFTPVVYFRDAALLCWTLLADGQLGEVDPAAPPGAPVIAITAVMRSRKQI